MSRDLTLPWGAWSPDGHEERRFEFPENWTVELLEMSGWPPGALPDLAGLRAAIWEEAKGKSTVSVAIEDLTRPTPLAPVLETVLGGLMEAGVPDSRIDLVMALGAHGPPDARGIRRKVGDWVADRFTVRLHDPTGRLADTGMQVGAIPLRIDAGFWEADLRVGLGSMIPNPFAGFSGGAKIVLPGLASLDVLVWLHSLAMMGFGGGVASVKGNRVRAEIERVGAALPLHFSVACLVDSGRRLREVFYGRPGQSYAKAHARARTVYTTPMSDRFDILLCSAYPKDGEFLQAENAYSPLRTGGMHFLAPEGSVVLMAACHGGRGRHGLFDTGMPLHRPAVRPKGFLHGADVSVYAPGISEADCRVTHWEGYCHFREWGDLMRALLERHGEGARAGVFPAGALQLGPERSA
ncbi:MAG: lactate racemase domain-containing protein [Gemmatimonadota bacterium]|nr:lactate racemase domain-containing protein [Gemmatimonadota bacterium]